MGAVIGDLLPLAVGVAISPLPIVAVILMLFSPRAGSTSAGFLTGWIAGVALATAVFVILASVGGLGADDGASTVGAWIKILLGVVLLGLAVGQWRGRPRLGQPPRTPKWMTAIDRMTAGRAAALGLVLSMVNPKNLLLCAGAGVTIGSGGLPPGQAVAAAAVFVVIAVLAVALPVLGYAVAADRVRGPLNELREWLMTHNTAVMTVLLLVIGAVMVGKGIGALA